MADLDLLILAERVAAEFKARGMEVHVQKLRELYSALQKVRRSTAWDDRQLLEWSALFRLAPFNHVYELRQRSALCKNCSNGDIHTELTWSDGAKMSCFSCRSAWMET